MQRGFFGIKAFSQIISLVLCVFACEACPVAARATGTAVVMGVGRLGALLGPLAYSFLRQATGTCAVFLIISVFLMLSCTCVVLLTTEMSGESKERDLDLVDEMLPLDPSATEISRRSA